MKRKISLLLLAFLLVSLAFIPSAQADREIQVYVDGKPLHPDVPPMIVDGRTLVPLRAVAESLGCRVSWNENLGLVDIKSEFNQDYTLDSIPIDGPEDFKQVIIEALSKMDSTTKNYVISYIKEINTNTLPFIVNPNGKAYMSRNGFCSFNISFFNQSKDKVSHNELVFGNLGFLVHEATHSHMYQTQMDQLYSQKDQENICDLAAIHAIERAGGSGTNVYRNFKDIKWD
ncbi:MAG: copper amine oxidase N-terminal domain-containing protein [Firmicutes bacterium]|nr:copper amine oxidase N-terminal domain-containing protein [Bacillota bacterium]